MLLFSSCAEDISSFLEDEDVKRVIENSRVVLVNKTSDNLRVGSGSIAGLNPNKYYLVSVEDEDVPVPPQYRYVSISGHLSDSIGEIGRVSNGMMRGLTNGLTYTVWEATPLTGSMTPYIDNVEQTNKISATASGITLPKTLNEQTLALPTGTNAGTMYAMVPVGYEGILDDDDNLKYPTTSSVFLPNLRIMLWVEGTTMDYVFHDDTETDKTKQTFKFLRVRINSDQPPPNEPPLPGIPRLVVGITLAGFTPDVFGTDGATISWSTPLPVISQEALLTGKDTGTPPNLAIIELTNASDFDAGKIWWKYNDIIVVNNDSLDLNAVFAQANMDELWMQGTYVFTLDVIKDDIPYSATFNIIVGN